MNQTDFVTFKKMLGGGSYFTRKLEPDANGNIVYDGIAPRGKATTDSAWIITKLTYDANGNLTDEQTSPENSKWTERATVTYA